MRKIYPPQIMVCIILIVSILISGKLYAQVYANAQTNGVTGLCLLCGVSDSNNPVDGTSFNDYSTFNITVGLLGTSVYQTLIFPTASSTGCDSLIIGIGSGNTILSVNLLAGLTVQTFNGSTPNNDIHSADSINFVSQGKLLLNVILTRSKVLAGFSHNIGKKAFYAFEMTSRGILA
ncbi:MAG TPA: hypothetical protein VM802_23695 [Chitinophaga sp.]|uniref:hypothetical protein n=1 Tax=Chitinophaga sp. TaxID=1869181 RepID=UPI002CB0A0C0|nr:hypothetical protein [Chitinophaga sp.]HVI47892.1 hypothetical protein [Chitinophaga sp.]